MTLTFELDLDRVKVNQRAEHLLVNGYFVQMLSFEHTAAIARPGPLKWSVKTTKVHVSSGTFVYLFIYFYLFKHQRQKACATYMPVKSITMQLQ